MRPLNASTASMGHTPLVPMYLCKLILCLFFKMYFIKYLKTTFNYIDACRWSPCILERKLKEEGESKEISTIGLKLSVDTGLEKPKVECGYKELYQKRVPVFRSHRDKRVGECGIRRLVISLNCEGVFNVWKPSVLSNEALLISRQNIDLLLGFSTF